MTPQIPKDLVDAIKGNYAIAFVGSGLSIPSGAPSWEDLLSDLALSARRCANPHEYWKLDAASEAIRCNRLINAATILGHIPEFDMRAAIANIMRQDFQPAPSHNTLLRLNFRAIITTNYDKLLEAAICQLGIPQNQFTSFSHHDFVESVRPDNRFILHLHGVVDHPHSIVITWGDYARLLSSDVINYVSSLIRISYALWLGYGHSDPDVMLALAGNRLPQARKAYQLVLRSDYELAALCLDHNITPIYLDSYDQVPAFLDELAAGPGAAADIGPGRDDIRNTNDIGRMITSFFLYDPLKRLEAILPGLADPRIAHRNREFQLGREDLFAQWSVVPTQAGKRIAIIAPPGVGKTVLLSRFARWLSESLENAPSMPGSLRPLVVYLSADNLPDPLTTRTLWQQLERLAAALTSPFVKVLRQDPLRPWRKSRAIYVLFDGVDEFGARRQGELKELLANLASLANERGLNVFLTCRSVFWSQQVEATQRAGWDEFEIQPFTADEIKDIVGPVGLGRFAYDHDGNPKPGISNRLIVSFVLELRNGQQSASSFGSRFELYEAWARLTTGKGHEWPTRLSSQDWLTLFQGVALALLEQKTIAVPAPQLLDGRPAPFNECLATGILLASADREGVKFYHESLHEFFGSWALIESFQKVLSAPDRPAALTELPLARVDVDFLQPSVYGFLHERLGDDYVETLRRKLAGTDLTGWPEQLVRNLVEYVGMTYVKGQDYRTVVEWLLQLMRSGLSPVIRYNAARALERIHPRAPRPYFDYASDWGDRDWARVRNDAKTDQLCPYAIRAYRIVNDHLRDRQPGKRPLAVCKTEQCDPYLQLEVSAQLGKMLAQLLAELPDSRGDPKCKWQPIDWLLINFSHAWVRWYHPNHNGLLGEVRKLAQERGAGTPTLENLDRWVAHAGFAIDRTA